MKRTRPYFLVLCLAFGVAGCQTNNPNGGTVGSNANTGVSAVQDGTYTGHMKTYLSTRGVTDDPNWRIDINGSSATIYANDRDPVSLKLSSSGRYEGSGESPNGFHVDYTVTFSAGPTKDSYVADQKAETSHHQNYARESIKRVFK